VSTNRKAYLALALCLAASVAAADGDYVSPTNQRFGISLGIIDVKASTTLRVDQSNGTTGTTLNGESDLGLDSSRIEPKFDFMVRAGARHRVFFDYFTLDRSDTKVLAQGPDSYGGVVLLEGDPVTTDFRLQVLQITYGYSFWHSEKLEIAATLSINDAELESSVRVNTEARHVYDDESVAGPFPAPGLMLTWVASKRFFFDATARYLKVAIDHTEGSIGIYEFDAQYRLRPNISFALGYADTRADFLSRKTDHTGYFNFDAKGPELFVRVAF
jgi:hypothetical protein